MTPGYPNGETRLVEDQSHRKMGKRGELKHLSTHRKSENSCNYSNKLKVASILWKEVRNSRNEKIYSKNLLTEYADKINEYISV